MAGFASNSVAGPTFGSIAVLVSCFVNNSALGSVIVPTFSSIIIFATGVIVGHVVFVVIDPKTTFFYSK